MFLLGLLIFPCGTMGLAAVIEEMENMRSFLLAQEQCGICREDALEMHLGDILVKIEHLRELDAKKKHLLTTAIASSSYNASQKKQLASMLMKTVTCNSQQQLSPTRRSMQSMVHMENYIPMKMWVLLKDPSLIEASKLQLLGGLASNLGLSCPSEPTLFKMVSIFAYCQKLYDMMQDDVSLYKNQFRTVIQDISKKATKPTNFPHITSYPSTPAELPDVIKSYAYPDNIMPETVHIPELDRNRWMRSSVRADLSWWNKPVVLLRGSKPYTQHHARPSCFKNVSAHASLTYVCLHPRISYDPQECIVLS